MVYHLKRVNRKLGNVILLIGAFCLPGFAWGEVSLQHQARIEDFHATLIEAMQISDIAAREVLLAEKVSPLFDTQRIAAVSLGRTWRGLSEKRRAAFLDLLSELIVATYADRFDKFSNLKFITEQVTPVKSGYVVQTRLVRSNGESVKLDYLLRNGRVFNVVADGVSDLSLRRADYNSVIKTEGYEALLDHMRKKISLARADN